MTIESNPNLTREASHVLIVIVVESDSIAEDLEAAGVSLVPPSRVARYKKAREIERSIAPDAWLIIDVTTLLDATDVKRILDLEFSQVVAFCTVTARGRSTLYRELMESGRRARKEMRFHDFADVVLGRQLRKICGPYFSRDFESTSTTDAIREPAMTVSAPTATFEGVRALPRSILNFLLLLKGQLFDDPNQLTANFVNSDSSMIEHLRKSLKESHIGTLADSERVLREFATLDGSAGLGHFIIGPAGVGKSTLSAYVLQSAEELGDIIYLRLDCTNLLPRELIRTHFLKILEGAECEPFLNAILKFAGDSLLDSAEPSRLAKALKQIISEGEAAYESLPEVPFSIDAAVRSACDRGVFESLFRTFPSSGQVENAPYNQDLYNYNWEDWANGLLSRPKQLFTLFMAYFLLYQTPDYFDRFFYGAIIDAAVAKSDIQTNFSAAFEHMQTSTENTVLQSTIEKAKSRHWRQFVNELYELPTGTIKALALELLANAVELAGVPLALLIDNVDQRADTKVEAMLLANAIAAFNHSIVPKIPNSRAIFAMRDTTHQDHRRWLTATLNWQSTPLAPPDLRSVLVRRCESWMTAANFVGEGESVEFVAEIQSWLDPADGMSASDDLDRKDGLVGLIRKRSPTNMREQLGAFYECCRSSLVRSNSSLAYWDTRSFEFFVRLFLIRDKIFFWEEMVRIPNAYDGGIPNEPSNPFIRIWLVEYYLRYAAPLSRSQVREAFAELNVPASFVDRNIESLRRFDMLEPLPDQLNSFDVLTVSTWGAYLFQNIVFDLPYISTIWWTTPMTRDSSPAPPRILRASELEGPADAFVCWLRKEEQAARRSISAKLDTFSTSVWERVSQDVYKSLRILSRHLS